MTSPTDITRVDAWQAFDSRGTPTVAARVWVSGGASATGIAPAGASTGHFEAFELRDGGDPFGGMGVDLAVANVRHHLGPAIVGQDATDQRSIDESLVAADGTPRGQSLGANALLSVSIAVANVAVAATQTPLWERLFHDTACLPLPMVNIVSGGAHAAGMIDIQDVLAVPVGAADVRSALRMVWDVRRSTADVLESRGFSTALVADEGGLAAPLASNEHALEVVSRGIEAAGLGLGSDVSIAIDVAANSMRVGRSYRFRQTGDVLDADGWLSVIEGWIDRYPVVSIEDPFADDDDVGWRTCAERLLAKVQLVGDDRFATDLELLEQGITERSANSLLVKPNQNGTLSGASDVLCRAQRAGWSPVVSARSGDTEQSWLADFAVGWGAGQIKVGSLQRSERTSKWNRLLELAATTDLPYAGASALAPSPSP